MASEAPTEPTRDPLAIAGELADEFAATAVERDKLGGTPKQQRDRLRASGLLGLIVPRSLGGLEGSWSTALGCVRRLAEADGSVAHVFGFQHLLLSTLRLFGSRAQWEPAYAATAQQRLWWGNALNPLDKRTSARRVDGGWIFSGTKSFCSGAADADRLVVSAIPEGETKLIIAAIPADREGLQINHDWDNMGQRQTDSGSVELHGVRVDDREVLSDPGPLSTPFASIRPCIAQATLAHLYLGIASGALRTAQSFTREQARPWFASSAARADEDPYVLLRHGDLWLELEAASALAERAARALDDAWAQEERLTAEQRGRCAIAIAAAKVATTRAGLKISSEIFDVMGARATAARNGFDRYWRDLRTHTLHDPYEYKLRDLGRWAVLGEIPAPSFYG